MHKSLDQVRTLIRQDVHYLDQMLWFPELNIGWYPIKEDEIEPYGDDYFEKFEHYETTEQGKLINDFRVKFVNDTWDGHVVDIGIGSGHFIKRRSPGTHGYDISSYGIKWLKERDLFWDPYKEECDAITCWDSLEHIFDCWTLIHRVKKYVFVSVPIAYNCDDAITFKHYKPREHFWYFTRRGLINCFEEVGFELVGTSCFESFHGREQIESFAFKRR